MTLRPYSTRRAAREAEAHDSLEALIVRVNGLCEFCGEPGCDEHHIANGQNRGLSLGLDYSRVWSCRPCHGLVHELPKPHAVGIAMAALRRSRPENFRLNDFYRLIARRFPDEALIERWRQILMAKTQSSF